MRYIVCSAIVLSCITSCAQKMPAKPQFEVASVRPMADNGSNDRTSLLLREVIETSGNRA